MILNLTEDLKNKYGGKALIVPEYASAKQKFYSIDDLKDDDDLLFDLGEVVNSEAHFTKEGIEFIEDAIGIVGLSEILFERKWFSEEFKSKKEILDWLSWWKESESLKYLS